MILPRCAIASRNVASLRPSVSKIGSAKGRSHDIGLRQPQGQLPVGTEVVVDEFRDRRGQGITDKISASPDLPCDNFRDIFRPMLGGVECDDSDRVAVLAGHQIADGGFEIGLLYICLAIGAAQPSEIIEHEMDGLIITARYYRRDNARTHA